MLEPASVFVGVTVIEAVPEATPYEYWVVPEANVGDNVPVLTVSALSEDTLLAA